MSALRRTDDLAAIRISFVKDGHVFGKAACKHSSWLNFGTDFTASPEEAFDAFTVVEYELQWRGARQASMRVCSCRASMACEAILPACRHIARAWKIAGSILYVTATQIA